MRRAGALLLLATLYAGPAAADESIARRLAALRALADATAVRAARVERALQPAAGGDCGGLAWWRSGDYGLRSRIDAAVRHASLRYGVDARLLRAVIRYESNSDPDAVSHRGALGLMQLMPATARELGVVCPFDPRENILGGARYLREMHLRFGSWPLALAAYNAGPVRVTAGRIPRETRRYVRRVVASWRPQLLAWIDLD